ncbi:conserved membrane protein [Mycobacterium tuberculosis '98-R604 INH-RIF-EM']|nr:conserved membrane protein [Mycobacterium tuberculosis '98-R604 INH-RIF-EM']
MNLTDTVATILAILALTAGTGVFVAAEFSLTALDRSTVEANARGGTSRDRFIQRAHHRLSFQLSGAQLGISITTLATGYLTEPLVAELPHPGLVAVGMSDRVADGLITFFALVIVTSLSMVFGDHGGCAWLIRARCAPRAQSWPARCCSHCCSPRPSVSRTERRTGSCVDLASSRPRSCAQLAHRRSWCRWCVVPRAAAHSMTPRRG